MRLLANVFLLVLVVTSYADEDWKPIRPRLTLQSANQESDGIYYEPSDSNAARNIPGYSIGSGLRSLAETSANQAHAQVLNQNIAAQQAAFVTQKLLAQSAKKAAETANAALVSKKALLDSLQEELYRAKDLFKEELSQLEIAKKSAGNAETSAQHSKNHASVLTAALNSAKMVAEQAKRSTSEAAAELSAQTAVIGKTKANLKTVQETLEATRIDYEATKAAAENAMEAAHEAQRNAQRAGNEVSTQILQMATGQNFHIKRSAEENENKDSNENAKNKKK